MLQPAPYNTYKSEYDSGRIWKEELIILADTYFNNNIEELKADLISLYNSASQEIKDEVDSDYRSSLKVSNLEDITMEQARIFWVVYFYLFKYYNRENLGF